MQFLKIHSKRYRTIINSPILLTKKLRLCITTAKIHHYIILLQPIHQAQPLSTHRVLSLTSIEIIIWTIASSNKLMCKNKIIKLNKLLMIIMIILSSLVCQLRKRWNLQASNSKLIDLIALRLNKNFSIIQVIQAL